MVWDRVANPQYGHIGVVIGVNGGTITKEDGYLKSIRYSKEYDLYRQNYCGCRYSIYDEIDGD